MSKHADVQKNDLLKLYLFGYSKLDDHVLFSKSPPLKKEFRIIDKPSMLPKRMKNFYRKPVGVSLRTNINGVKFHPNADRPTIEAGVKHRIGRKLPEVNKLRMKRFTTFVEKEMEKLDALSCLTDFSLDSYLQNSPHPLWKKNKYREAINEYLFDENLKDKNNVGSFIKKEFYPEIKHARAIMSRDDAFKCLLGPFIHQVEKYVFELPEFVKKIPNAERPRYIHDKLYIVGNKYIATDYSSFESSMVGLLRSIEHGIYKFLLKQCNEFALVCKYLGIIEKPNVLVFDDFRCICPGRASGEVTTSIGNGLINYFVWKYLCMITKIEFLGVFEGDDGLCSVPGDFNSSKILHVYEQLGLVIKLEEFDDLGKASFCGCIFSDLDFRVITSPLDMLTKLCWTGSQYIGASSRTLDELLKLKALSICCQFPGHPILFPWAKWVISQLDHIDEEAIQLRLMKDQENTYYKEWFKFNYKNIHEHINSEVLYTTRMFVDEMFGIPIWQQRSIERNFTGPLRSIDLNSVLDEKYLVHFEQYVRSEKDRGRTDYA